MSLQPIPNTLGALSRAFAAACHQARSEPELYEGCRRVLAQECGSDALWLSVTTPSGTVRTGPDTAASDTATATFRCQSGETELVVHAPPDAAEGLRGRLPTICFGLSVILELRSVLLERQTALDDAVFQVKSLRQVVRVLSSVHSAVQTAHLVHDFMSEVFFAWWAALYRQVDGYYEPVETRSLSADMTFERLEGRALDRILPPGSTVSPPGEVGVSALVPAGTELVVPLDAGGERLALMLLGPRMGGKAYDRAALDLAGTLALASAIALKNAELVERLHSAATTDGLTGLLNRRAIEERLEAEVSRGVRHHVKTTVALIDLDRFKLINDTLGHGAGDRFLVHMGELLRQHVRSLDIPGRLGGDEFLVILPMTSAEEAQVFVARLRHALEAFGLAHPEFGRSTISIGLAESPRDGDSVPALLAAADSALYAAKAAGRNVVRLAQSR